MTSRYHGSKTPGKKFLKISPLYGPIFSLFLVTVQKVSAKVNLARSPRCKVANETCHEMSRTNWNLYRFLLICDYTASFQAAFSVMYSF